MHFTVSDILILLTLSWKIITTLSAKMMHIGNWQNLNRQLMCEILQKNFPATMKNIGTRYLSRSGNAPNIQILPSTTIWPKCWFHNKWRFICCRGGLRQRCWGKCQRGVAGRWEMVAGGLYVHHCRWVELLHRHSLIIIIIIIITRTHT